MRTAVGVLYCAGKQDGVWDVVAAAVVDGVRVTAAVPEGVVVTAAVSDGVLDGGRVGDDVCVGAAAKGWALGARQWVAFWPRALLLMRRAYNTI